jgi:putative NADH-flavin reductase
MNIAIIGATGNVGSRILAEALRRGHRVTAIARHPEKLVASPKLIPVRGDVSAAAELAGRLAGHDLAISAVRFLQVDPRTLIATIKQAHLKRLLVVGGAATLELASGLQLLDTPTFPPAYRAEAEAGRDFLQVLQGERRLDWTFLSPSAAFAPGERTGKFRLGQDRLLTLPDGESRISMEDYAIAMLDEAEHPRHIRERFTVGY